MAAPGIAMEGTGARRAIAGLLVLAAASPALAGDGDSDPAAGAPATAAAVDAAVRKAKPGVVPVLVATVPGLFASGAGTWTAGDKATGAGLFQLQLLGLGIGSAGALPMFLSGASRRTTALTMPLVLVGSGIFLGSWVADIYASATGGRDRAAFPAPDIEGSAGYAYVHDPQFDYASFAVVDADFRWGAWRATPSAWIAVDDDTQRLRGEGAWTFWRRGDSSFAEARAAATLHRTGDYDFDVYTVEVSALGRYAMERLGAPLRGSFLEIGIGVGEEIYRIDGETFSVDLPIARAGYGMYLGRGEAQVYYDHRHDELTGGLGTGLQFDGPYGHFGVEGMYWLTDRWGVEAQLEIGSALTGRLALLWAL